MDEDKGLAWEILIEQHKITRSMIKAGVAIVIAAFIALASITGTFVWYLYQYDYSSVTYTAESGDSGNAIINESGEVTINGESEEDS